MAARDGLIRLPVSSAFARSVSREEARVLQENPDFQPAYTGGIGSTPIFAGEIGRYHGVRYVVADEAALAPPAVPSADEVEGWLREYEASISQAVS